MFQITLSKDNNANGGQRSESRPAVDVFLGREDLLLVGILLLQELLELFFFYIVFVVFSNRVSKLMQNLSSIIVGIDVCFLTSKK